MDERKKNGDKEENRQEDKRKKGHVQIGAEESRPLHIDATFGEGVGTLLLLPRVDAALLPPRLEARLVRRILRHVVRLRRAHHSRTASLSVGMRMG